MLKTGSGSTLSYGRPLRYHHSDSSALGRVFELMDRYKRGRKHTSSADFPFTSRTQIWAKTIGEVRLRLERELQTCGRVIVRAGA